jgi:hypothetical protein
MIFCPQEVAFQVPVSVNYVYPLYFFIGFLMIHGPRLSPAKFRGFARSSIDVIWYHLVAFVFVNPATTFYSVYYTENLLLPPSTWYDAPGTWWLMSMIWYNKPTPWFQL